MPHGFAGLRAALLGFLPGAHPGGLQRAGREQHRVRGLPGVEQAGGLEGRAPHGQELPRAGAPVPVQLDGGRVPPAEAHDAQVARPGGRRFQGPPPPALPSCTEETSWVDLLLGSGRAKQASLRQGEAEVVKPPYPFPFVRIKSVPHLLLG